MKKGSITLYLCLLLLVMLSLICAALFSARNAAGRTVFASAVEQGMYSLFSRYDRTLLDRYGILALDGGYGGSELKLGALQDEAEDVARIVMGDSQQLLGASNLTNLCLERGEVTGYCLLTDQDGALFRQQICRAASGKIAASVLQNVENQLTRGSEDVDELQQQGNSVDAAGIENQYQNIPSSTEGGNQTQSYRNPSDGIINLLLSQSGQSQEAQAGENPIEVVRGMRNLNILTLVVPKNREISYASIEEDRVSKRSLQQGMGVQPEVETNLQEKVLMLEYLAETYPSFTTQANGNGKGLKYQLEYALEGKTTDDANLKAVLKDLLALREIANYLYLRSDPAKREEIATAAVTICSLLGIPVGTIIVEQMLTLCWAYGESILDLRELLRGGKIPLKKDASSWQLSLAMLTHLNDETTEEHSSANGLDYTWYLRILLYKKNVKQLTSALMDLTEHQIRQEEGKSGFRLDNCLVSMKIRFEAVQDGRQELEAERSYNYYQE